MKPRPQRYGVAGVFAPVTSVSHGVGKLVSVLVSVADPAPSNSLLHTQLELEAEVGIELSSVGSHFRKRRVKDKDVL